MLEGISSLSFYILHVCMHVNQTKLEKKYHMLRGKPRDKL